MAAGCDSGVIVGQSNSTQTNTTEFDIARTVACVDSQRGLVVCPASDMAKITRSGDVPYEHTDLDWSTGPLQLRAARNETIAFQLILRTSDTNATDEVSVALEPMTKTRSMETEPATTGAGTTDNTNTDANRIQGWFNQALFTAYYHPLDNAGYLWGPQTEVLPWPDEYPDALVPTDNSCSRANQGSANQSSANQNIAINTTVPVTPGTNQALWIDTYIDRSTEPGTYSQNVVVTIDDESISLPIDITVYDVTLPDKPSINAVGELYRTYFQEGAGYDITEPQWQAMAQCYQQLAHQHRMVFIERLPDLLTAEELEIYADIIQPAITGELFSAENGYVGPGANTPVTLWKTPWPQTIDGVTYSGISDNEIQRFDGLAYIWDKLVERRGWTDTDYFAYVFDEVDGPNNNGDGSLSRDEYLKVVHDQIARVQSAIDNGSESTNIDLIWTSHSNPSQWRGDPDLDLTDIIRLWAPNASAADTEFLKERIDAGEKAWFYHSGHPAIGAHSINVSGIEMRTWGVVGARYGFQGQFMWAVNLGNDEFPYRDPQFNVNEDRAGNGVMVYPGNQLDKIGYEKSPGPVPSMRLKAWRRGLQDAELYYLAYDKSPNAADTLLKQQMPAALTEGRDKPSWSSNTADWIDFHRSLLELASE